MKIVIDTNAIISALIRNGTSRDIITNRYFEFIAPSFTLSEIEKYKDDICKKTGFSLSEFYELLGIILKYVRIVNFSFYDNFMQEAMKAVKDSKDVAFLALAIAFNCPIWSDDRHFQQQNKIKTLTTKDIKKTMGHHTLKCVVCKAPCF